MRKKIKKKMPEFGISPIELGFYRFIKSNLIKTAVLSGVEVSVLPGGVEAIEKGLDYPNASAILENSGKERSPLSGPIPTFVCSRNRLFCV